MRKERLENLSLDVRCGSKRQRYSDKRVFVRWFDIYVFTKILWFRRMNEIISTGDYLVMYKLFNIETIEGS